MVRVENLLPAFVGRRIPDRPAWVADSPRDPWTAAKVYGWFALGFSTLFFLVFGVWDLEELAFVPLFVALVVMNAASWTWLLWSLYVPADGTVSRRRALTTGLGIGTLSWLTVGPLLSTATTGARLLTGGTLAFGNLAGATLGLGLFFSLWGFMFTLGIPTVASVGLALWTLDYEERSGREKRETNSDFQ